MTPTEPVWKATEPLRPAVAPAPQTEAEPQAHSRETEADVRTLIIGPGVSVKGEITSCNRLIVEGKIEAKLADCPNVIIKQGGVFKAKARLKKPTFRVALTVISSFVDACSFGQQVRFRARLPMARSRSSEAEKSRVRLAPIRRAQFRI